MQGAIIIKDHVGTLLDGLGGKLKKPKAVAEAMGLAIVGLTMRSFNDPSVRAAPWSPLRDATIAAKLREGKSTAILKRNVLLARSWRITDLADDHVKVGSDRFYAWFHQFGTQRVSARPMLPLIGPPSAAQFTDLAVRRMVSVAKAALAGMLLPGKTTKPPTA